MASSCRPESGKARAAAFQPVVRRAVQLYQFAFAGGAQPTLAMRGSAALAGRSQTGLAQQTAQGFATQGKALDLAKFFAEVVIVEAARKWCVPVAGCLCGRGWEDGADWAVRGWRAPEPPPLAPAYAS